MVVLLVLFTIIVFLTIDYYVQQRAVKERVLATPRPNQSRAWPGLLARRRPPSVSSATDVPGGVFLSPWHVWVQLESSGSLRVGVDRLILNLLGGLDCVYVLPEGSEVHERGPLTMLRSGHRALRIRSPVDGVISEVNERARRSPDRVTSDPYESGWLYRISPVHVTQALSGMVVGEEGRSWMRDELARLRDVLVNRWAPDPDVAATMADGGLPMQSQLDGLGDREWEDLVKGFFVETGDGEERPSSASSETPSLLGG
jgi:glycine cleavage system H protein